MNLKRTSLLLLFFIVSNNIRSQSFLKKIKDNITSSAPAPGNKTADNSNTSTASIKKEWCDTVISEITNPGYTLAYTSQEKFTIMYDESRIGINRDPKNYRLILKQWTNNKPLFIIVDNGKVTETVTELKNSYIIGGLRQPLDGLNPGATNAVYEKYIIADTTIITFAAQKGTTITTPQSIDEKKIATGYEVMKTTDEYKNLSPEEKKQIEEVMKTMPQTAKDYSNSGLAGKTVSTPETKGGSYSGANGYFNVIIKGKKYGHFAGHPYLQISADELNVYIVGGDSTGKTNFMVNGKKIPLDTKGTPVMGHVGKLLMSADGKKAAFVEIKPMTEKELKEMLKTMQNGASMNQSYLITKSDGTTLLIPRSDGSDEFRLTNGGELVYLNTQTGEVISDGHQIGKFNLSSNSNLSTSALLFGNDPSKMIYYNDDGSLSFMDGSKKDMGSLFPQVFMENGKSYISWFRKCNNSIYIGRYSF